MKFPLFASLVAGCLTWMSLTSATPLAAQQPGSGSTLEIAPLPAAPTVAQITGFLGFPRPLRATGLASPGATSASLAFAINAWLGRQESDDHSALVAFVTQHPDSAWTPSVQYTLGRLYYTGGYFTRATQALEQAWQTLQFRTDEDSLVVGNRAAADLALMYARVGRQTELTVLLNELKGRTFRDDAKVQLDRAREALNGMKTKPGTSFKCGPYALANVQHKLQGTTPEAFLESTQSPQSGFNLAQLRDFAANQLSLPMSVIKRSPGSGVAVPVPSVVHLKSGHFGALTESVAGRFLLKDPTFGNDTWVTRAALEDEGSGYFLVPTANVAAGHQPVADEVAATIYGKGHSGSADPKATKMCDAKTNSCPNPNMAGYSFHLMLCSLSVSDIPFQLPAPPFGSALGVQLVYNQREYDQPADRQFTNFTAQWVCGLVSYLEDDPSNDSGDVALYPPGGGSDVHTGYTSSGPGTGSYARNLNSGTILVRTAAGQYEWRLPDGSKYLYTYAVGSSGPNRKVFLTQILDPWGNATTLSYLSGSTRLGSIANNAGQSMHFFYNNSLNNYLVTQVADNASLLAAQRVASFNYVGTTAYGQRLASIVDTVGITSAFTYDETGFLNTLTTPYGATRFASGEVVSPALHQRGQIRWVQATDPNGDIERAEFRTDINDPFPGFEARTTFYWPKEAWHEGPGDFSKAHAYLWRKLGSADVASSVISQQKAPLESATTYNYAAGVGNSFPSSISRKIEGPTGSVITVTEQYQYQATTGKPTRFTDADGKVMRYVYNPSGYDVTAVEVLASTGPDVWHKIYTLGSYLNHQPRLITDASGVTTTLTYNSKGQVKQMVVAGGGTTLTTKYIFDNNGDGTADEYGWPLRVQHNKADNPAQFVNVQSVTWDSLKRLQSWTNEEGYTLQFAYDGVDRITTITHPDSTTEQYTYQQDGQTLLGPTGFKDRAGRWTRVRYDRLGRPVMQIDALQQATLFEWCRCGSMSKLEDASGKITRWKRDGQGRVTEKLLSDGKHYFYAYQPLSGRLASVSYPKDYDLGLYTVSYLYGRVGQLVKKDYRDAAMADVTFEYGDYLGRLTKMTDGFGDTTYGFVPLNQTPVLSGAGQLRTVNGPFADDTQRYSYDEMGRNHLREIVDDDNITVSRTEQVAFDGLERVSSVVNNLGTFSYSYNTTNLTGTPNTVALPGGFTKTITRYAANAGANALRLQGLQMMEDATATVVSNHSYTYNLAGDITSWQRLDKTWNIKHDAIGQLVEVNSELTGGAPEEKRTWQYDLAGNMLSTTVEPDGQPAALEIRKHEGRNQLTALGGPGRTLVAGTVDEPSTVTVNGQPAKVQATSVSGPWRFSKEMSFAAGLNSVTVEALDGASNVQSQTYEVTVGAGVARTLEYDANGNLVKERDGAGVVTRLFEWDAENQLVAVQSAEVLVAGVKRSEFGYDGNGLRVRQVEKEHNGTAWTTTSQWFYVWDGLELAQKRDVATGIRLVNYFASGEQQSSDSLVYDTDHLGSVRGWYRVSDGLRGAAEYDPYGERAVTVLGAGVPERGFTGHLTHETSGLVLAPFRAYDPQLGRWLSEDPIAESGGLNLYGYSGNRPASAWDTLGLWWDLTFDRAKGRLSGFEVDAKGNRTGKTFDCSALSGARLEDETLATDETSKDIGPIPVGTYHIMQFDRTGADGTGWYPLKIRNAATGKTEDPVVTDPRGNKVTRTGLFLHQGSHSAGCVTVLNEPTSPGSVLSKYSVLEETFRKTAPLQYPRTDYQFHGKLRVQ